MDDSQRHRALGRIFVVMTILALGSGLAYDLRYSHTGNACAVLAVFCFFWMASLSERKT